MWRVSGDLKLLSHFFYILKFRLNLLKYFFLTLKSMHDHPLPKTDVLKSLLQKITLEKNKWRRAMKIYYFSLFFFTHNETAVREEKSDIDERIKIKSYSNSFLWATFLLHFDTFSCLLDYIRKFLRQSREGWKWRGGKGIKFLS